jgi:hypothetical protein
MKAKRVWAVLLAATMVIGSTVGVSATTFNTESETTGVTVQGTGSVDYVKTTVYNVGLPTTTAITLTVDPQGLSTMADDSSATAADLADAAGKITCTSIVPVTNAGSVPVKVSVTMGITGNATVKDKIEDVDADNVANVLMYAVPSAVDTENEDGYQASNTGIVLGASTQSDTTIGFVLPAADYVFKKDASGASTYERDETKSVHGTALKFEGLVNKNADWSDYVGANPSNNIGLTAKFTFTHVLADTDVAGDTDGAPFAMIADSSLTTVTVENGPQISISDAGLITISNLTADQNYTNLAITMDGTALTATKVGAYNTTGWDKTNGGTVTFQFSSTALTALSGHEVIATVALSDGTTKSATKTFD